MNYDKNKIFTGIGGDFHIKQGHFLLWLLFSLSPGD